MTRVAIACDHAAVDMKREIIGLLEELGVEYRDYGPFGTEKADYPVYGRVAAEAVASGECDRGVVICGSGVGISISANKVKGIRCVVCSEPYSAVMSRRHNDTNMLAFGARVVGVDLARMITAEWLKAEFEGGRHQRRVNQIIATELGMPIENQMDPSL